jgi:hypothetical protein
MDEHREAGRESAETGVREKKEQYEQALKEVRTKLSEAREIIDRAHKGL